MGFVLFFKWCYGCRGLPLKCSNWRQQSQERSESQGKLFRAGAVSYTSECNLSQMRLHVAQPKHPIAFQESETWLGKSEKGVDLNLPQLYGNTLHSGWAGNSAVMSQYAWLNPANFLLLEPVRFTWRCSRPTSLSLLSQGLHLVSSSDNHLLLLFQKTVPELWDLGLERWLIQLKVLVALAKDQGLIPSSHMAAYNYL